MPQVNVKMLEGAFTLEQQQTLIEDIQRAFQKIGGDEIRPHVHIVVEEVKSGLWSAGGTILTKEAIEARRRARLASKES
jgi:4-oxalocrotonate tautomerase family enzyme